LFFFVAPPPWKIFCRRPLLKLTNHKYFQLKNIFRQTLLRNRLSSSSSCNSPAVLPFEFRKFRENSFANTVAAFWKDNAIEILAEVWNANLATMIRNGRHIQIVRFEDLVTNPQFASVSIMQRLRMTLPVPQINRIIR